MHLTSIEIMRRPPEKRGVFEVTAFFVGVMNALNFNRNNVIRIRFF